MILAQLHSNVFCNNFLTVSTQKKMALSCLSSLVMATQKLKSSFISIVCNKLFFAARPKPCNQRGIFCQFYEISPASQSVNTEASLLWPTRFFRALLSCCMELSGKYDHLRTPTWKSKLLANPIISMEIRWMFSWLFQSFVNIKKWIRASRGWGWMAYCTPSLSHSLELDLECKKKNSQGIHYPSGQTVISSFRIPFKSEI